MKSRSALVVLVVALGVLAALAWADTARTFRITISDTSTVGTAQLEPGQYRMLVDEPKIRFTHLTSGESVEVDAKVETVEEKYPHTSIHQKIVDGVARIVEIRLSGSRTRVIFPD